MTNEFMPRSDDDRLLPPPTISTGDLRRRLRVRLEHHLSTTGFHPALTVVGLSTTSTHVLRHGVDRPEDAIVGFVLPPQYSAIGVLASSVVATPPHRGHRDAAIALAVTRTGDSVSMLATRDAVIDTQQPTGWLIDACLRAVGLATAPCESAALAFPLALWLDRLMVSILGHPAGAPIDWINAVDLCPVPRQWRTDDPIDLGRTLASTARSWKALRLAAIEGPQSSTGMTPERAAWMDDAMFARWCLGSFPDLASLRADVEFLASDHVADKVAITLRAAWAAFTG